MVLRRYTQDRRKRRSGRFLLVLLGCLALSAYFVHHTITGKHGFEARTRLIERSRTLEREIAGLEAVRAALKRDVALLSPDTPDADIVEEYAIRVLGMARPEDIIVLDDRAHAAPVPEVPAAPGD
jgi:cell division protein FtsB